MANNEPKTLDYQAKEVEKVYEGKSQEAVVNQSPKDNITNTITVDEVKEIAGKVGSGGEPITPFISGINQIGSSIAISTGFDEEGSRYYAYARFILTASEYERLGNAKFIIFTMNNSFVMTPLAQNNYPTRSLGSFIYDGDGNTMVVRLKITKYISDDAQQTPTCLIEFDEAFAQKLYENELQPFSALLIAE